MRYTAPPNPTLDKLMVLARGDFELVNRAIRECQEWRRWRWWHWKERRVANLGNVVRYIVDHRNQ